MSANSVSIGKEWVKKMKYIYRAEYHSAIKKNEIMPFAATWMDIDIVIPSEVSQKRRNIVSHLCEIEKEMIKMNLLAKQKERE